MSYVPCGPSVQITDRAGAPWPAHRFPRPPPQCAPSPRGGANLATARHRSQILVPPPVLYSQIPLPNRISRWPHHIHSIHCHHTSATATRTTRSPPLSTPPNTTPLACFKAKAAQATLLATRG